MYIHLFCLLFIYNINSLIWSGFPMTSFNLAETSLSAFSLLYTLVCAVVQKYHEISFIYFTFVCNYLHFSHSFCNQPVLFTQLEKINKLWNNNQTKHVKKRNQNKNKIKSRHIQIDHAFHCSI